MSFAGLSQADIRQKMDEYYRAAQGALLPRDREMGRALREAALELIETPKIGHMRWEPGRTLDVGSGPGGVAAYWPGRWGLHNIVGLELSQNAVRIARETYPTVEYIVGAIETFKDARRFDTIVAVESIEHWVDPRAGLVAIRSHLTADGYFILTTPNRDSLHCRIGRKLGVSVPFCCAHHVREWGYEELRALLADCGFEVTRSIGVGLAPYWALEAKFGTQIRELTDRDDELAVLFADAGRHTPEIAFCQAHACRQAFSCEPAGIQE